MTKWEKIQFAFILILAVIAVMFIFGCKTVYKDVPKPPIPYSNE